MSSRATWPWSSHIIQHSEHVSLPLTIAH